MWILVFQYLFRKIPDFWFPISTFRLPHFRLLDFEMGKITSSNFRTSKFRTSSLLSFNFCTFDFHFLLSAFWLPYFWTSNFRIPHFPLPTFYFLFQLSDFHSSALSTSGLRNRKTQLPALVLSCSLAFYFSTSKIKDLTFLILELLDFRFPIAALSAFGFWIPNFRIEKPNF